MNLSFVIPVYNEEQSLQELHEKIVENIKDYSYEIIFVNDGSTDNSKVILKQMTEVDKNVKVINFRTNFGKSAALQTGFNKAKGKIVFTMDADLQDDPKEIPRFIEKIEEGYDLVSGWKKNRKDPLTKTIPSKFFNLFTSLMFKLKLHDYNCGFKAYKNEVVKSVTIYGELHRYIPALANAQGFSVTEIPVTHHKRKFGKTKYGAKRFIKGFLDLLTVNLITKYEKSPLYLFGLTGIITTFLGFVISLYLAVSKIFFGVSLSNRPLLFLGILLILVGIQFISIGLIGEFIVYLDKKKQKKLDQS
ncbi:MAG: glycosyltransferase family 2 protein [Candidatus Cloacimonetes bacterium]|nr:glycosyltransferase family 2 protein [Candidatus Cloacimonadota bacterium]MBS3766621.1 glycosyltransferase family 2 protein [Candidatus Cloacimonadota bacterium]